MSSISIEEAMHCTRCGCAMMRSNASSPSGWQNGVPQDFLKRRVARQGVADRRCHSNEGRFGVNALHLEAADLAERSSVNVHQRDVEKGLAVARTLAAAARG